MYHKLSIMSLLQPLLIEYSKKIKDMKDIFCKELTNGDGTSYRVSRNKVLLTVELHQFTLYAIDFLFSSFYFGVTANVPLVQTLIIRM